MARRGLGKFQHIIREVTVRQHVVSGVEVQARVIFASPFHGCREIKIWLEDTELHRHKAHEVAIQTPHHDVIHVVPDAGTGDLCSFPLVLVNHTETAKRVRLVAQVRTEGYFPDEEQSNVIEVKPAPRA